MNGTIGCRVGRGRGWGRLIAEIKVSGGPTACFGLHKIGGVAVNVEAHIAGVVADGGLRIGVCIIHEHFGLAKGSVGGSSLLGGNFIEGNKHSGVNGTGVIQEGAGDGLHTGGTFFVKEGGSAGQLGKLYFGAVRRGSPLVRRMLRAGWWGMVEAVEGFGDIAGHGYVDVFFIVVPFYC